MQFAFDRSARTIDADGRLHVAVSNISKACVSPYMGNEIPNYESLGLIGDKVYKLFRAPEELEKSAPTFNNLPLLTKHVPVNAQDHRPELIAGSTGTDAIFKPPYLRNSLVIWDQLAIDGIESGIQKELSCAYRYKPVMTPGEYQGEAYDGIMTDIVGNHVALVEVGRAGPDVVVGDSNANVINEGKQMTKKEKFLAKLKPFLAQDMELQPAELAELINAAGEAELSEQGTPEEAAENAAKPAVDGDEAIQKIIEFLKGKVSDEVIAQIEQMIGGADAPEDAPKAEDEEDMPEKPEMVDKKAMDSAIRNAEQKAIAKFNAIRKAEKKVAPLVGEVSAMDSAAAVYKFALDSAGIDVTGVDESAYGAMVDMLVKQSSAKPVSTFAQDSASASDFLAAFPSAKIPKRV